MDSTEEAVHVPSSANGSAPHAPHAAPTSGPPQPSPTVNVKPAAVVIVRTAEELQLAVEVGSRDIEIRAHLDMRNVQAAEPKIWEPRPLSHTATRLELLPAPSAVRSIRGACDDPDPAAALGLSDADLLGPSLLPLKPYQCLLLIQDSWLAMSNGRLWVDNVYLRLSHKRIGGYAFIYGGHHNLLKEVSLDVTPFRMYITNTTFQADLRGNTAAVSTAKPESSVYMDGCILTDWDGSTSPLTFVGQSVAHVRNTIFRNMQLRVEVVDVSLGSTVRLVNVSLADVELGGGHIVSTTFRNYVVERAADDPMWSSIYMVYPGDDYDYPFEDYDVPLEPVLPSERTAFEEQYNVGDATRSDCRFMAVADDAILPGCSEKSRQWRLQEQDRLQAAEAILDDKYDVSSPPGHAPAPAKNLLALFDPGAVRYEPRNKTSSEGTRHPDMIQTGDPWLSAVRTVLPTRPPAPEGWPLLVPDNSSTSTSSPVYSAAVVLVPPLSLMAIPEAESKPPLATPHDTFPIGASAFIAISGLLCLAILAYLVVAWRCGPTSRGAKRGSSKRVELAACTRGGSEAGGVVGGGTLPLGPSRPELQMKQMQVAQLMRQLDECRKDRLLLGQFEVLGRAQCAIGGDSVVQYALNPTDGKAYAIKFFLDQNMFRAEATLHAAFRPSLREHLSSRLASAAAAAAKAAPDQAPAPEEFLPKVLKLWDNADGRLHDAGGKRLPPLLVMHRQVSLQDWADDNAPDVFSVLAMLSSVSKRLSALHDAGYVHCNLKPSKILLPASTRLWKVSGFSRVMRAGSEMPLRFTLAYAAPEVVAACMSGCKAVRCTPALDAWALGVVAFELLTATSAFNLVTDGSAKAVAQLRGEQLLPWEGPRCGLLLHRLGALRPAVLHLIERDPAQRATARQFHTACSDAFSQHMEVDPAI